MSGNWRVSTPRMKQDEDEIQSQTDQIPTFIQELDASMKRLGQCWDGPAWLTFQQQVELDIQNMLDIYDWMKDFLQAFSQSAKKYGEAEEKSYTAVENVKI